jgi:SAM-dependent methyltransferase
VTQSPHFSTLRAAVKSRCEWKRAVETASRLAATVRPRWAHDAHKFLDLDRWVEANLRRAQKLGLMDATGLHILDLGSGAGQFLFFADTMGHNAVGLDLPADQLEHPEREIYTEMPVAFGVRVVRERIRSFQALEVEGKFDLITSTKVCFNNHKLEDEWGRAEWEFFVQDALSRLKPGGRLALRLNHHEEKFGPRGYLDRETTAFFASLGTIDDGKILIAI